MTTEQPTPTDDKAAYALGAYRGETHKITAHDSLTQKRVIVGWLNPVLDKPESDTELLRSIEVMPFWSDARIEHVQNRATGDIGS